MSLPEKFSMPKVLIVVLNYRNFKDTIACLRSLAQITYRNTEIVVVDNDSQNDSLEHVRQALALNPMPDILNAEAIETSDQISGPVLLLQSPRNGGYASGNNLGIRIALKRNADYVMVLNNDTEVSPDFLEPLVNYAETHAMVGSVGPKVLNRDGRICHACARRRPQPYAYFFYYGMGRILFPRNPWARRYYYYGEYSFDGPREVDILSGCCMLIKSATFRRIGLLDENTFLLHEEVILHEKLRAAGLVSAVVPTSVVVHKHGESRATAPSRIILDATRNSIRYYLTHYRHLGRFSVFLVLLSLTRPAWLLRMGRAVRGRME
jgi:GT2 family glycosyltransferase